ncbi:MAG TPA: long-chain fatty acid--CoA ligase [Candidatus Corynebacterium avicola]|uniref:Long-chain fatty acid--CoA ligase n=1 Tax=Candidatus Corynebacterium avicola TaxID=2838527 RepID=A0A9D1RQR2_9CORY|nr:long-chain fatty acid--CoA ligase [Candidatus Corynebacterium avicola]
MQVDISSIRQLQRHADLHGEDTAIVYEGTEFSYTELMKAVGKFAAALREDGVGRGDRVAYAGLNSVTFFITFFSAIWVGATFVPLNFRLVGDEMRGVLRDARPDVVLAEPVQAAAFDEFLGTLAIRKTLLVDTDPNLEDATAPSDAWLPYSEFVHGCNEIPPHEPQHDEDLAALLYTSGSTGRPKGVMLTHGNLWWGWNNVDSAIDTRADDVSLAVAPLFHIGGLNAFSLRTLTHGGTLLVRRKFDPAQALRDIEERRVTTVFLVPAMLTAMSRQPNFDATDLSSLRATCVAAAPVPPDLISLYAGRGVLLQQAWGLTETAPFSTNVDESMVQEKLGSCGTPMPYTRVKVVNPESLADITESGEVGELWVQGPNVSVGYWNNPKATRQAFTDDGWFRTGDLGRRDEDGYYYIVDRLKDMVLSGGENIYPAQIENALFTHPDIVDVAVIGIPHEKWGETVCAVVQFKDDPASLEDIREFLSTRVASYKLPRALVVTEEVARNGSGKLDKQRIRREVLAEASLAEAS